MFQQVASQKKPPQTTVFRRSNPFGVIIKMIIYDSLEKNILQSIRQKKFQFRVDDWGHNFFFSDLLVITITSLL